jgi:hypothetical protein
VRLPPFNLVDAPHDLYLGPKCRARVSRPEGIHSPHTSDDELEPAVTFFTKFKFFLEDSGDFSEHVARAY